MGVPRWQPAAEVDELNDIVVQPLFQKPLRLKVPTGKGLHSGGDNIMLGRLFADSDAGDPYRQFADSRAGAYSIAVGVAANRSIATGKAVDIEDVLGTFARPEYRQCNGEPSLDRCAHYPFLAGAMAIDEGLPYLPNRELIWCAALRAEVDANRSPRR